MAEHESQLARTHNVLHNEIPDEYPGQVIRFPSTTDLPREQIDMYKDLAYSEFHTYFGALLPLLDEDIEDKLYEKEQKHIYFTTTTREKTLNPNHNFDIKDIQVKQLLESELSPDEYIRTPSFTHTQIYYSPRSIEVANINSEGRRTDEHIPTPPHQYYFIPSSSPDQEVFKRLAKRTITLLTHPESKTRKAIEKIESETLMHHRLERQFITQTLAEGIIATAQFAIFLRSTDTRYSLETLLNHPSYLYIITGMKRGVNAHIGRLQILPKEPFITNGDRIFSPTTHTFLRTANKIMTDEPYLCPMNHGYDTEDVSRINAIAKELDYEETIHLKQNASGMELYISHVTLPLLLR